MPVVTVQELIDAGVHFGHQARRWNPKMKPFIHGRRHKIHVINLKETIRGLVRARHFLTQLSALGGQVVFVGTKRQIRTVVQSEAKRCGMPAITERWIGGTLTNFNTVRERLTRLEEIEGMESDGSLELHKKKAQSTLRREMRKIQRNLEGVRDLHGLPAAIIVVDPRREEITLREAARMNVPVVAILDTDCDPDLADITIPANDDAMSSVQLLLAKLADAIIDGRSGLDEQALAEAQKYAANDPRAREVAGRRQQERGPQRGRGRREPQPGGREGRQSTGRFASRAGGHADSVSIGGGSEAPEVTPVKETEAAPAAAAPATEKPVAETPAPAADAPAPEAKAPEAPATPEAKPETKPEGQD